MTEESGSADAPQRRAPREVGGDLILPLAGLVFTVYYFVTIWDLTWEAQVNGLFIGLVLIALIVLYLIRTALAVVRGEATLGMTSLKRPLDVQLRRAALLVLSIAFIFLIQWLGFTLATGAFLFCALYALGVKGKVRLIGVPLVLSVGGYLLFIVLLDTRFPRGIVEHLLEGLF